MHKPWSVVDDDELKALRELLKAALDLSRGCDCEYDYRCGGCEQVLKVKELAAKAKG